MSLRRDGCSRLPAINEPRPVASAILSAMRTTLDIDDDVMTALLARHPGRSKTGAIEHAIQEYLRRDAIQDLLEMAGTLEIEDRSAESRRSDRR